MPHINALWKKNRNALTWSESKRTLKIIKVCNFPKCVVTGFFPVVDLFVKQTQIMNILSLVFKQLLVLMLKRILFRLILLA